MNLACSAGRLNVRFAVAAILLPFLQGGSVSRGMKWSYHISGCVDTMAFRGSIRMSRRLRWLIGSVAIAAAVWSAALWVGGSIAAAPARARIGAPPADLPVEAITIASASGSRLSGWFIAGAPH